MYLRWTRGTCVRRRNQSDMEQRHFRSDNQILLRRSRFGLLYRPTNRLQVSPDTNTNTTSSAYGCRPDGMLRDMQRRSTVYECPLCWSRCKLVAMAKGIFIYFSGSNIPCFTASHPKQYIFYDGVVWGRL